MTGWDWMCVTIIGVTVFLGLWGLFAVIWAGRISRREEGIMCCGHHVDELVCSKEGTCWCAACEREAD